MSLFHAKHAKHAKSDDLPDGDGAMLTMALMRTRDAIVGTEDPKGQPGQPADLSPGERLARMDTADRSAVLLAELSENLSLSLDCDGPSGAKSASLSCRQSRGRLTNFIQIDRPQLKQFQDATEMVGHYAELRPDRVSEVEVQTSDLLPFFAAIRPLEPSRNRATLEMLRCALDLTTGVVMRIKLALACPRPGQFSNLIQPMIACPSHPTFPSGHATQAFCLAGLLIGLDDPKGRIRAQDQLIRLACRIAVNRTVAGVHFPADSAAGAVLGLQLAAYLLARAGHDAPLHEIVFDGHLFQDRDGPRDFHYGILSEMLGGKDPSTRRGRSTIRPMPAPLWTTLVARARTERENRWS